MEGHIYGKRFHLDGKKKLEINSVGENINPLSVGSRYIFFVLVLVSYWLIVSNVFYKHEKEEIFMIYLILFKTSDVGIQGLPYYR